MKQAIRTAVIVAVLAMVQAQTRAALVAYYTLDDTQTTNGLKNGGTGGTSYDLALSSVSGADTSATVVTGIIGDKALRFGGSTGYQASGHPSGYPFTFSLWVANVPNGTSSTAAMSITQTASSNRYYSLGVSSTEAAEGVRRNTTPISTSAGSSLAGTAWHNLVGVFTSETDYSIYVDGQFGATQTTSVPFDSLFNALILGGIIRTNSGALQLIAPYSGDLDDAGVFDTALTGADVALINGLGQTGGLGLNWLGDAQSINAAAVGASGTINGVQWQHVSGLAGDVGAWGGSVAGGDAFIVTGSGGEGIQVVPEPGAAGLVVLAMGLAFARRHRRQKA
jgi:hypothetical protein